MSDRRDHYRILGLEVSATSSEIKTRFRSLALQYHPDKNGGSAEATERFILIKEALDLLSDPHKRAQYDKLRRQPQKPKQRVPRKAGSKSTAANPTTKPATKPTTTAVPRHRSSATSQQARHSTAGTASAQPSDSGADFNFQTQRPFTEIPQGSRADPLYRHPHASKIPNFTSQPPKFSSNPFFANPLYTTPPLQQTSSPGFPLYPTHPAGPTADEYFEIFRQQGAQHDYSIVSTGEYIINKFRQQQATPQTTQHTWQFAAEPELDHPAFQRHASPEPPRGFQPSQPYTFCPFTRKPATSVASESSVRAREESHEQLGREAGRAREMGRRSELPAAEMSQNDSTPHSYVSPEPLSPDPLCAPLSHPGPLPKSPLAADSVPLAQTWHAGEGITTKQAWEKAASQRTPVTLKSSKSLKDWNALKMAHRKREISAAEVVWDNPTAAEEQQRLFNEASVKLAAANVSSPPTVQATHPAVDEKAAKEEINKVPEEFDEPWPPYEIDAQGNVAQESRDYSMEHLGTAEEQLDENRRATDCIAEGRQNMRSATADTAIVDGGVKRTRKREFQEYTERPKRISRNDPPLGGWYAQLAGKKPRTIKKQPDSSGLPKRPTVQIEKDEPPGGWYARLAGNRPKTINKQAKSGGRPKQRPVRVQKEELDVIVVEHL